ncbi:MAG: large subunit ribosomal protein [Pseudomonadota bacterium]|nr:large subunit ribosomal protein [Pseudomonadota bacterium]
MAKLTKQKKLIRESVLPNTEYKATEAVAVLKKFASKKFNESVDVAINLGVDPRKSDQVVRSSTLLPKGTGKTVRVAVFAQGDAAEKAKAAGADKVGFEDLAEELKSGNIPFDVIIATPDAMRLVGQLGTILGPRGLMPNPKVGTVTMQVENAVRDAKAGQVRYRTDKNGIIHCSVGKVTFNPEDIVENVNALIADLKRLKPASAKGIYIKKVALSSTMGPGLTLDLSSLSV